MRLGQARCRRPRGWRQERLPKRYRRPQERMRGGRGGRGGARRSLSSLSFHLPKLLPNAQERVPAKNNRENRREHSPHIKEGSILEERSYEVRGLDEHHTEKECACDEITDLPSFERHYGAKKPQDGREKTGERHHQVRCHRKR